jgi:hypothetical protein
MQGILDKIKDQTGVDIVAILAEDLSGSALNSLLLAVFDHKTRQTTPAQLLQLYDLNRFVKPADVHVIQLRLKELNTLQLLAANGFEPLELSPVSLLGTCSVVGTVNQKKIISATRGTEVLSDATNAIAMHIAHQKKVLGNNAPMLHYCTTHRHIRTQPLQIKGHTPHFTIACLVTAGKDTGNFSFEKEALTSHVKALQAVLKEVFNIDIKYLKLQLRDGYKEGERLITALFNEVNQHLPVIIDKQSPQNDYYHGIQYKVMIAIAGKEIEIADGGLVTWTQQLLDNRKERLFISGLGIEYLSKILV